MIRWIARLLRRPAEETRPTSVRDLDDDVIYELPYISEATFRVSQGYGGNYSHTEDSYFSIDFRMPEGTPICASRGGVVYRVINHFTDRGNQRRKPKGKPKEGHSTFVGGLTYWVPQ